jgi:MYXO-CTERM domain-containing protein
MLKKLIYVAAIVTLLPLSASAYVGYDDESDPLYGWSDTENPDDSESPEYVWDSISGSMVSFSMGEVQGPFDIGFEFEYYEEIYDQVYLSGYGALMFGSSSSAYSVTEFPNPALPNNVVGVVWNSSLSYYSGSGSYETSGSAGSQRFTAQFNITGGGWWWGGGSATAQVVLEEGSNDIYIYVEDATSDYGSFSIGMENDDGTRGISAYYSSMPLTEYAAYFSPSLESPRIRVTNEERIVDEGGSIDLVIEVRDRVDGDPVLCTTCEIAWDIDKDGEFDDGDGDTATISAADVDGPNELAPAVRATDTDGNVTERTITVDVRNMPPVFTVEPVTTVLRNFEWTYDPQLVDPCAADRITAVVDERPVGAVVLPGGALRWQPTSEDVGAHTVRILAFDDDDDEDVEGDGDSMLEFTLNVTNNTPPGPPLIVQPAQRSVVDTLTPTFLVQTPLDAESDQLFINYDIDTVDTYNSPGHPTGRIPATLGQTGWTLADVDALVDGESYYWRVFADDGVDPGPAVVGRFDVDLGIADAGPDGGEDAGPDGGDDGGPGTSVEGCNCGVATPSSSAGPLALALIVGGLLFAMRRTRD